MILDVPFREPEDFISVIEMSIEGEPMVDNRHALDPELPTEITVHFANSVNCTLQKKRWMEKFGEWKLVHNFHKWEEGTSSHQIHCN